MLRGFAAYRPSSVDDVLVRQGLCVVADYVKATMIARSRRLDEQLKAQAKARAALEAKWAANKQAQDTAKGSRSAA